MKTGGKAFLDVIDGNLPANKLYESLRFEQYSGIIEMQSLPEEIPPAPDLRPGYTLLPLERFEWKPRFDLAKRISPENLLMYKPVEEGRFRQPKIMRLVLPIIIRARGRHNESFQIEDENGQVDARMGYSVPLKERGFSELSLRLDPNCPELAPYIIGSMLNKLSSLAPNHRVEVSTPFWMAPAFEAAQDVGFEKRLAYNRMGLVL